MSLLLNAYKRQKTERPPIWFMRQAGRYLPEYLALREKYSINQIINNAELATEVTLQPLRRFNFDGSIVFADLLTPFQGLGIEFDFIKNEGPKIFNPISSAEDIKNLAKFDLEKVKPTLDAISLISTELSSKKIPLLGFAGAPFTLSSYLIEGQSNPKVDLTKRFMFNNSEDWQHLQSILVDLVVEYLTAQVQAGAQAVQLFDSWLGAICPTQYGVYVEPYLRDLIEKLKKNIDVPIIFFATGVAGLYPQLKKLPVDVIGIDWRVTLHEANLLLDGKFALQGNLDPQLLFADWSVLEKSVLDILEQGKHLNGYVFNLGHGILPKTPIDNVERVVELVRNAN